MTAPQGPGPGSWPAQPAPQQAPAPGAQPYPYGYPTPAPASGGGGGGGSTRVLAFVGVGVVALLFGVLLGALLLGGLVGTSVDEVKTNAVVRAAEGTWQCEGEDSDDDFEVQIDRSGIFKLDSDDGFVVSTWSVEGDRLTLGFDDAEVDGVPTEVEDASLDADGSDVEVKIESPTEVTFTAEDSDGNDGEVRCEQTSSERPDIPQGLVDD